MSGGPEVRAVISAVEWTEGAEGPTVVEDTETAAEVLKVAEVPACELSRFGLSSPKWFVRVRYVRGPHAGEDVWMLGARDFVVVPR